MIKFPKLRICAIHHTVGLPSTRVLEDKRQASDILVHRVLGLSLSDMGSVVDKGWPISKRLACELGPRGGGGGGGSKNREKNWRGRKRGPSPRTTFFALFSPPQSLFTATKRHEYDINHYYSTNCHYAHIW